MGGASSTPHPSSLRPASYDGGGYPAGGPPRARGGSAPRGYFTPSNVEDLVVRDGPDGAFLQAFGVLDPASFLPGAPRASRPAAPPPILQHTSVARTDVHLFRDSLLLLADDADPNTLYLEFVFNAHVPCTISVFYGCCDDIGGSPAGCPLSARLKPLRPAARGAQPVIRHRVPAGVRQRFSQALLRRQGAPTCFLDTTAFAEHELTNAPHGPAGAGYPSAFTLPSQPQGPAAAARPVPAPYTTLPGNTYPIVVCIEPELPGGAGGAALDPNTVTCQATYATLVRTRDAAADHKLPSPPTPPPAARVAGTHVSTAWRVLACRARIQAASGKTWKQEEIYGLDGGDGSSGSSAGGASGGGSADVPVTSEGMLASGADCVICLTDKRDTTVLPCRHMCLCYACAQQLTASTNKCPVCRAHVESLFRIVIADGQASGGGSSA